MPEPSYGDPERRLTDGEDRPTGVVRAPSSASARGRVRVLVVDERPLVRSGVGGLLRAAGIDVAGEAPGVVAAAAAARDARPDVVLMHAVAERMRAADAVRAVAGEVPGAKVIVVAAPTDAELLGALAAGACGAIVDEAAPEEIVAAIHAAHDGESVFSPAVATALMRRLRLLGGGRMPSLSAREHDVLELVARGWDNARIAGALYVSTGTVKHHISSILAKLGVENRTQAAVRAVQLGLIGP
jgi:DNA-binding NarL/FixJ family response regulator